MSLWSFPLLPESASTAASRLDPLFWTWVILGGGVSLAVFGVMIFFLVYYHASADRDRTFHERPPTRAIEWTWTLVPMAIFIGMFGWAAWLYYQDYNPPADALTIYVVGKQWMWKVQHPEGPREIDELHVPVGRPVRLVLASEDVIHDFYVPAFRMKQDVVPGRFSTEWFQATKVGEYHLFCSEFCGTSHALMAGRVVVMPPEDYARWLEAARPQQSLAARGEAVFRRAGCSGCHGPAAAVHAPKLDGIFARPQPLEGGGFAIADEAYLRDAILLPKKQIVAGYKPIMPSFQGQLTEDELIELVAYIRSTRSTP